MQPASLRVMTCSLPPASAAQLAANIAQCQPHIVCLQGTPPAVLPDHLDMTPATPSGCAIAFNRLRFRATPDAVHGASFASLWDRKRDCAYFVVSSADADLHGPLAFLDEWTGPRLMIVAGTKPPSPDLMQRYNYLTTSTPAGNSFIYALGCPAEKMAEPTIDWPHPEQQPRLLTFSF